MTAILEPPEVRVQPLISPSDTGSRLAAFLELPETRARIAPLSVKACEVLTEMGLLDKRIELIRGILLKKMPKSPLHRKLTQRIFVHLFNFKSQRVGLVAFVEAPLRLIDSVPEPDVMIVRGEESDFDNRHPTAAELVVEVAVSSVELDRKNASLYAEAGVPEYWIVLGNEQQVEVYRQLENGVYRQRQLYSVGETLICTRMSDLQVTLADWFA